MTTLRATDRDPKAKPVYGPLGHGQFLELLRDRPNVALRRTCDCHAATADGVAVLQRTFIQGLTVGAMRD
jgi:hypothetical protein